MMSTMSRKPASPTSEMVFLCQKGERNAQAEFYEKYKGDVARTVFKVFGPDPDLEDVIQDVFIEAFRSIEKFKGKAKVSTWLYRVAFNVALQRLRKRKRRREVALPPSEAAVPCTQTPQRALENQEQLEMVYKVLDRLTPKKRIVFILHEFLGLNSKEIAGLVDANVLTVRTRLHYARKEFYRRTLQTELFAEEKSS